MIYDLAIVVKDYNLDVAKALLPDKLVWDMVLYSTPNKSEKMMHWRLAILEDEDIKELDLYFRKLTEEDIAFNSKRIDHSDNSIAQISYTPVDIDEIEEPIEITSEFDLTGNEEEKVIKETEDIEKINIKIQ